MVGDRVPHSSCWNCPSSEQKTPQVPGRPEGNGIWGLGRTGCPGLRASIILLWVFIHDQLEVQKHTGFCWQGLGSRQMSWPLNPWDGTHIIGQFCGSSHLSLWTCPCKKQFGGWGYAALLGHPSLLCCQHSTGGTSFQKESMGKWREHTMTARWH